MIRAGAWANGEIVGEEDILAGSRIGTRWRWREATDQV